MKYVRFIRKQKGFLYMYDSIIIGAGIAGATTARKLAEEKNN